ncbi:phosphoadenosine phosphosulfate reductase family protein [Flaviaesturariibacter aridisoli]|nr:phosphoadenosine phosphosulfate reductase family protein [Flaviaesturariibacter aridisoli]
MVFLQELNDLFAGGDAASALRRVSELFPGRAVCSTSLGQEDGVLTDLIARNAPGIRIFTMDTGHNFPETIAFRDRMAPESGLELIVRSDAAGLDTVIAEIEAATLSERGARIDDKRFEPALEKRKK